MQPAIYEVAIAIILYSHFEEPCIQGLAIILLFLLASYYLPISGIRKAQSPYNPDLGHLV